MMGDTKSEARNSKIVDDAREFHGAMLVEGRKNVKTIRLGKVDQENPDG